MTLATPPLDLTLARCPLCGAEEIQLTSDQVQPDALRLTLSCAVCHHAEDAGAVVRHGRDLLPWVLLTWGAVLAW